jgi:hypothetical protein
VAAAVVVAAGLAALLLDLAPVGDPGAEGGPDAASPSAPGAAVPDRAPSPVPRESPTGPDPAAELADTASAAVAAWQVPGVEDRAATLAPLATPAWLEQAATIDPYLVPAAPVERSRLRVESDGRALVDVELADGTALAVVLVLADDGRWLVDEILPTAPAAGAGSAR